VQRTATKKHHPEVIFTLSAKPHTEGLESSGNQDAGLISLLSFCNANHKCTKVKKSIQLLQLQKVHK
jgi:hypothetical protein